MTTTTTTPALHVPTSYADAIDNAGWRDGRTAYQRGYVSRKADPRQAPLHRTTRGEYYVLLASTRSTQYCVRQYLLPR